MSTPSTETVEWRVEPGQIGYRDALERMTERNRAICEGEAREMVWMLEHPPVYTAGTSADGAELLDPRFEVVEAGRGGRYTYHGPGQRVGYIMLDLKQRGRDVRCFVHAVEGWVIATLADLGVESWRSEGRIGIWTRDISKAHRTAARLRAGTVWVNTYNIFDAALPFGGYKQSGWGREMGHEVLNLYTETKAICIGL